MRVADQLFHPGAESRQDIGHDRPHEGIVDAEVVVDELVAHSSDLPPRDVGVLAPQGRREALGRLADNLELSDDCVLGPTVGVELRLAAGCLLGDVPKGIPDVEEEVAVRLHRGTAEARMRSCRMGDSPPGVRTWTG